MTPSWIISGTSQYDANAIVMVMASAVKIILL